MNILINFVGTCVTAEFPQKINSIKGAPLAIEKITNEGHLIYLKDNLNTLEKNEAISWFRSRGLNVNSFDKNINFDLVFSSTGGFCELNFNEFISKASFVDWKKTLNKLVEKKYLSN